MKKYICVLLALVIATAFSGCSKDMGKSEEMTTQVTVLQQPDTQEAEVQAAISDINSETDQYLCSVPTINRNEEATKKQNEGQTWLAVADAGTEQFLAAALEAISKNPKFDEAKIINNKYKDQYLQLGEIGGEPCVRVHLDTSEGDFVAVMTEDCEILFAWEEGDEKTIEYYFPQAWDVTVASDENLNIAYHNFKSGGYHDEAVIYDYRQTYESRDGKFLSKVELFSTCCVSTFWIDEAGRVVDRTK